MLKKVLMLVLCATFIGAFPVWAGELLFTEAPVPQSDLEKRVALSSQFVSIDGKIVPFGFHTILRSGDTAGSGVFGQLYDTYGNELVAEDGSKYISNSNDFASLLVGANENLLTEHGILFMVSHFESRPGAMYLTKLKQTEAGKLVAVKTRNLDFSHIKGGWVHCAGSVTPWGSHLGSEEYEPDAKQWRDGNISDYNAAMAKYFGDAAVAQDDMNPYDYGYPVEVKVQNFDNATVEKHYAMGRIALELAYVMPDKKTAYLSDDGTNVGLFCFIADQEGDLSAGTLYVAKWVQTDGTGAGKANIEWISLGHATSDEIKQLIDANKTFTDIFEEAEPIDGACPDGFTSINAGHGDGDHQCLKVKAGMEKAASRLETRRYAAMLGGTTEFRKMEGITYNPDTHELYIAMSEVGRGMENNKKGGADNDKYDVGGPNDITLAHFNTCGAVYALGLKNGALSEYEAASIEGLIEGIPTHTSYGAATDDNYDGQNKCDVKGIANPDNITYIPGYDTLIIGEDSGSGHQNDMIWAFNIKTLALTRIQTTPYGSETTSPYFYPDINGFAYIMSVIQHPYGESDSDKLVDPSQQMAYTGYLGPLPAFTNDTAEDNTETVE
jgi:secreted PhoX family phosphatase